MYVYFYEQIKNEFNNMEVQIGEIYYHIQDSLQVCFFSTEITF